VDNDFPKIAPDEYIKATDTLEKLQYKYGYMVNDYIPIYRKSPIMTLRDALQINRIWKTNGKLYMDAFHKYDIRGIKEYQTPIYYVLGRHDEWTSSALAAEYFDKFQAPHKGLYWIEDAGHMVDTDNPEAFYRAIKEIIAQLS
jgi:pimeloyl-ACP methyl ester carboxylesterase